MSAAADIAMPNVVVLGSLHLDVMLQAPGLPRLGETLVGSAVAFQPGGKGGNQAVAAARHGGRVAMIGAVGEDAFGTMLRVHLRAQDVDDTHVTTHPDAASGMSVAVTEPGGDYAAIIVSGVNLRLGALSAEATALLGGARWLVLQNEVPDAANLAAAAAARAAGCKVILNAAPARTLPAALAGLIDILVVNAIEAEDLCGVAVTDAAYAEFAAAALRAQAPCVIVTAGGDGLALADPDGCTHIAAYAVAVVSTHGAGDTFVGALAARLAAGDAPAAAARYANAAAALLVAAPSAARGSLGPEAVTRMLARAPPPEP